MSSRGTRPFSFFPPCGPSIVQLSSTSSHPSLYLLVHSWSAAQRGVISSVDLDVCPDDAGRLVRMSHGVVSSISWFLDFLGLICMIYDRSHDRPRHALRPSAVSRPPGLCLLCVCVCVGPRCWVCKTSTTAPPLHDEILYDLSFEVYVLSNVRGWQPNKTPTPRK